MEERLEKLPGSPGGISVSNFYDGLCNLLSRGPVSEDDPGLPALLSEASPSFHRLAHHNGLHKLILSSPKIDYNNGHYYLKKHLKKPNTSFSMAVVKSVPDESSISKKLINHSLVTIGSPVTHQSVAASITPNAGSSEAGACDLQKWTKNTPENSTVSEKHHARTGNSTRGKKLPKNEMLLPTAGETLPADELTLPADDESSHCLQSFKSDIPPIAWDLMPNAPNNSSAFIIQKRREDAQIPTSNTCSSGSSVSRRYESAVSDCRSNSPPTAPDGSPFDKPLPSDDSADLESASGSSQEISFYDSSSEESASNSKCSVSSFCSRAEDDKNDEFQSRACSVSSQLPSEISPISNVACSPSSFDAFKGVSTIFNNKESKCSSIQGSILQDSDLNHSLEVLRDLSTQASINHVSLNSSSKSKTSNDESGRNSNNSIQIWKETLQKLARETKLIRTSLVVGKPQAVSTPAVPTNSPASNPSSPLEQCIFQFPSATTPRDSDHPDHCSTHNDGSYFGSARDFYPANLSHEGSSAGVNLAETCVITTNGISQLQEEIIVGSSHSSQMDIALLEEKRVSKCDGSLHKVIDHLDSSPGLLQQCEKLPCLISLPESKAINTTQKEVWSQQTIASVKEDGEWLLKLKETGPVEYLDEVMSSKLADFDLMPTSADGSLQKLAVTPNRGEHNQYAKTHVDQNIQPFIKELNLHVNKDAKLTSSEPSDQHRQVLGIDQITEECESLATKISQFHQCKVVTESSSPDKLNSIVTKKESFCSINKDRCIPPIQSSDLTETSCTLLLNSLHHGDRVDLSGKVLGGEVGKGLLYNTCFTNHRNGNDLKASSEIRTLTYSVDSVELKESPSDPAEEPKFVFNATAFHSSSINDASLEVQLSTMEDVCQTPDLLAGFHYVDSNQHEASPELVSSCDDASFDNSSRPYPCLLESDGHAEQWELEPNKSNSTCFPTPVLTANKRGSDAKDNLQLQANVAVTHSTVTMKPCVSSCDQGTSFARACSGGFLHKTSSVQDVLSLNLTYSTKSDCSPMVSPWSKDAMDKSSMTNALSNNSSSCLTKLDDSKLPPSTTSAINDNSNIDITLEKKTCAAVEGPLFTLSIPSLLLVDSLKSALMHTELSELDCVPSQIDKSCSVVTSSPLWSTAQFHSLDTKSKMSIMTVSESKEVTTSKDASLLVSNVSPKIIISPCYSPTLTSNKVSTFHDSSNASQTLLNDSFHKTNQSSSVSTLERSPANVASSTASPILPHDVTSTRTESPTSVCPTLFSDASSMVVSSCTNSSYDSSAVASAFSQACRKEDVDVKFSISKRAGIIYKDSADASLPDPTTACRATTTAELETARGFTKLDPELLQSVSLYESSHLDIRDAEGNDQEMFSDYEYLYKKTLQEFQEYQAKTYNEILQLTRFKQDTTLDLEEILREKDADRKIIAQLKAENAHLKGIFRQTPETNPPAKEYFSVSDNSDVVKRLKNNHDRLAVKYATLYADYQALHRIYFSRFKELNIASKRRVNEQEFSSVLAIPAAHPRLEATTAGLQAHLKCVCESYNACRQHLNELKDQVCLILRFIGPSSKDFDMALLNEKFLELWETESLHLLIQSHPSHLSVSGKGSRYPSHFDTDLHQKYMIFFLGCWRSCTTYTTNQYVAMHRPRPLIQDSVTTRESHAEALAVQKQEAGVECQASHAEVGRGDGAVLEQEDETEAVACKTFVSDGAEAHLVMAEKIDASAFSDSTYPTDSAKGAGMDLEGIVACKATLSIDPAKCDETEDGDVTLTWPLDSVMTEKKMNNAKPNATVPLQLDSRCEQVASNFGVNEGTEVTANLLHSGDDLELIKKVEPKCASGLAFNEELQLLTFPLAEAEHGVDNAIEGKDFIDGIELQAVPATVPTAVDVAQSLLEKLPLKITVESANDLNQNKLFTNRTPESDVHFAEKLVVTIGERTLLNCMPSSTTEPASQYRKALHSRLRRSSLPNVRDFKNSWTPSTSREEAEQTLRGAWQETAQPSRVFEAGQLSKCSSSPGPTFVVPVGPNTPSSLTNPSETTKRTESVNMNAIGLEQLCSSIPPSDACVPDFLVLDTEAHECQSSEKQTSTELSSSCEVGAINSCAAPFIPPYAGVDSNLDQSESVGNASAFSSRRHRASVAAASAPGLFVVSGPSLAMNNKRGSSFMEPTSYHDPVTAVPAALPTTVVGHHAAQDNQCIAGQNTVSSATVSSGKLSSTMERFNSIKQGPLEAAEMIATTLGVGPSNTLALTMHSKRNQLVASPVPTLSSGDDNHSDLVSPSKGLISFSTVAPPSGYANNEQHGYLKFRDYNSGVSQLDCPSPSSLFRNDPFVGEEHHRSLAKSVWYGVSPSTDTTVGRCSTLPYELSSTCPSSSYVSAITHERPLLNFTASDINLPLGYESFKSTHTKPVKTLSHRPQKVAGSDEVLCQAAVQEFPTRSFTLNEQLLPLADVQKDYANQVAATSVNHDCWGTASRQNVSLASSSASTAVSLSSTNQRLSDEVAASLVSSLMVKGEQNRPAPTTVAHVQELSCNPWIKIKQEKLLAGQSEFICSQTSINETWEKSAAVQSSVFSPSTAPLENPQLGDSTTLGVTISTSSSTASSSAPVTCVTKHTSVSQPGLPYIPHYTEGLRGAGRGMTGRTKSSSSLVGHNNTAVPLTTAVTSVESLFKSLSSSIGQKISSSVTPTTPAIPVSSHIRSLSSSVGQKNTSSIVTHTTEKKNVPLLSIQLDVPLAEKLTDIFDAGAKTPESEAVYREGTSDTPSAFNSVKSRVPTPYPKKLMSIQFDDHPQCHNQVMDQEASFNEQLHVQVGYQSVSTVAAMAPAAFKKTFGHHAFAATTSSTITATNDSKGAKVSRSSMYGLDRITDVSSEALLLTQAVGDSSGKFLKRQPLRSAQHATSNDTSTTLQDESSTAGSKGIGGVAAKPLHSVRPKQRSPVAAVQAEALPEVPGGEVQRGLAKSNKTGELVELKNYLLRYFQHISRKQLDMYLQEVREKSPGCTLVGKRFHEVAAALREQICLFEGAEESRCCMVCGRLYGKKGTSMLKCLHCFHTKCIKMWAQLKKQCPLCLSDLEYDDEGEEGAAMRHAP